MPDSIDLAQDAQIALNNASIGAIINRKYYEDNGIQMINGKKVLCKRCLKPISKKRLKAIPNTTVCTHCSQMLANGATLDDYDPEEEDE